MKNRTPYNSKTNHIFIVLTVILVVTVIVSFVLGRYDITVWDALKAFAVSLGADAQVEASVQKVVINVRLPRIILTCLVGGALSVAGCSYQTIFHNPMASPDILGASQGACFGAALFS